MGRFYSVNKSNAQEWLVKSFHDLDSAKLLIKEGHFTDTISCILQQAIEKSLKSILASENKQIKKTHNLLELYELVNHKVFLSEEEIRTLTIATVHYRKQRYPSFLQMPSTEEIQKILIFAENLFSLVCKNLEIDSDILITSEFNNHD